MDRGILTASFATLFIGFSITIASATAKIINPLVLTTLGYIFSILFLFILSKTLKEKIELKKLWKSMRELLSIVISRSIIGHLMLVFGFSMVPAIRAIFLMRLEPVFVFLISIALLKEQPKMMKIILILFLILGALIFTTEGSFNILAQISFGDLLVIGAMLFLAYSYIPSSRLSKKVNSTTITLGANILPLILFLPAILLLMPVSLLIPSSALYLVLLYTILFYVLGLFLWFRSLGKVKPWIVASILSLEPVAGSLLAYVWLGQILSYIQFLGASIMIIATYFIARENVKSM